MAQQMLTALVETTGQVAPLGRKSRKSRSSYSLALKLRALEEVEQCGLRAAARNLSLDERVIRQWLGKSDALKQAAGRQSSGAVLRVPKLRFQGHDDDQDDGEVDDDVAFEPHSCPLVSPREVKDIT